MLSPFTRTPSLLTKLLAAPRRLCSPDLSSNGANGNERSALSNPPLVFSGSVSTAGHLTVGHPPSFSTTTAASSGHRSYEGYASSPPSSDPHGPLWLPIKPLRMLTTTALRTPAPTTTPMPRTTLLTTAKMERAIMIITTMILAVRPRCVFLHLAESLISPSLTPV